MPEQQRLAEVFVELADTLVADFDLIEFLHRLAERCVELLEVEAAGILLTDQADELQVIAASSEQTRLLELFQLQSRQGPCLDCFATGRPIRVVDLAAEASRWPVFAPAALDAGYSGVLALPMRMRERVIGAMNLFTTASTVRTTDEAATIQGLGQAMADVATIGILGERAAREHELLSQQLQIASKPRPSSTTTRPWWVPCVRRTTPAAAPAAPDRRAGDEGREACSVCPVRVMSRCSAPSTRPPAPGTG